MTDSKPNTGTLHILNKSPDHPRFSACLAAISVDDVLVLTENAVLVCADTASTRPARCHALQADLHARGLQGAPEASQSISYADLVRLTTEHSKIISW